MSMEQIDPHKWYSVTDLTVLGRKGILPITARSIWLRLLGSGAITCINRGVDVKPIYSAKGSAILQWLQDNTITNDL